MFEYYTGDEPQTPMATRHAVKRKIEKIRCDEEEEEDSSEEESSDEDEDEDEDEENMDVSNLVRALVLENLWNDVTLLMNRCGSYTFIMAEFNCIRTLMKPNGIL